MVTSLPCTRNYSPPSLLCTGTYDMTRFDSKMSLASWVPPGCFLGASWMLPGCLLGVSWIPGRLKIAQNHKIPQNQQNTCSKDPGACFCLRSPKRRRQLRHRRTGLGDPLGVMELCKYTIILKTICSSQITIVAGKLK